MSLLGSIFGNDGDKKKKKNEELSSIFQKSAELPETPHYEPVAIKRKARQETPQEEEREEEEEIASKKKKKKRKWKEDKREVATGDKEDQGKKQDEADDDNQEEAQESSKRDNDDDSEERTVFVGNLPLATTTRKSLAALFKDCGPIESTRIRSVPVKGTKLPPARKGDQNLMRKVSANTHQVDENLKNTVQGYVVFKSKDSMTAALEKNNLKVGGGLRIRVDKASPTVDPVRSVFVGNLPYGAEETTLQEHFVKGCDLTSPSDVEGVRIIRDKETFQCKGFGYVLFKERSMVPLALKLHETTYMKRQIRVQVCGKRFKNKQKAKPAFQAPQGGKEQLSAGAFRRILAKQTKEAVSNHNKRKRGEKKKNTAVASKKSTSGISKRAALDKKVDQRVRKLQKRMAKGMGKARRK